MGLEWRAVSAQVTKHFVSIFSKTCNNLHLIWIISVLPSMENSVDPDHLASDKQGNTDNTGPNRWTHQFSMYYRWEWGGGGGTGPPPPWEGLNRPLVKCNQKLFFFLFLNQNIQYVVGTQKNGLNESTQNIC